MLNSSKIKVVLIDDHELIRVGLKNILEQKTNIKVIGEAANGREGVKLCKKLVPDIVLIAIAMPDLNGIEATKQILKQNNKIKIICVSIHSCEQFVLKMLNAGAYAYLLKDGDCSELILAVKTVLQNKKYLAKDLNQNYLKTINNGTPIITHPLSSREREVLQLIAEGNSSKEIASVLFLSSKTIDVHRTHIMKKLGLFSIAELTKYAIKNGITNL
ncbi:response regulator transcription factor [uncultured Polaribacter sp.]|uniref:response regulator n=1 Tax=uncultured Polaribacter sp. TaxID=174711 RepID=UPI002625F8AE|nr:response regulator transcription factor [uncultured Polaribacter sp.]